MGHRLEILAPAGDFEMLRAAVFSGADCVYLGLRGFNARRAATNFDEDTLPQAVAFCHARGCKAYAAVNTLVLPGREEAACAAIRLAAGAGCDALIIQDLAVAEMARAIAPTLPLHASTQMSVHSLAGVQQLAALGFSRAILARELSVDELAAIAAASPIELEVFIHGALCVSLSGQCYMSAFLGGRSANRGACAGPCRLPFRAGMQPPVFSGLPAAGEKAADCHHLSLKDLSILDALPQLEAMGIVAGKIEGRLRGPEYCAVVVDAARKALDGQPYDRQLVRDVFSRSGFTDGWFSGKNGGDMFGARSEQDSAASKKAWPKARELYRRERPRIPVALHLALAATGARLTVDDGVNRLTCSDDTPLQPADQDRAEALRTALAKTGGTPFFAQDITLATNGLFYAAPAAGALRRTALEQLLALRGQTVAPPPAPCHPAAVLSAAVAAVPGGGPPPTPRGQKPTLRARFASLAQMPPEAPRLCESLLLPLAEAEEIPAELRAQTWLWLPRALMGDREEETARQVERTAALGFAGYEVQNIAHWQLCAGLPMSGGFGLNLTNAIALATAAGAGCRRLTLSPELSLAQMRQLASAQPLPAGLSLDALAYGHMPLMLTRACPLKQLPGEEKCKKCGHLADRTGAQFPLDCKGGMRTVYNPVPLWMADRLADLPTHTATLYFTGETRPQAAQVLAAFAAASPAPGAFTRGLYDRGTED